MTTHDVKAFVHLDFYTILDVDALCEQKDIDRAWRKFALKYHPDKVSRDKAADAEVFYHQGRIGKEILSDPTSKQIYSEARAAKERKRQQDHLLDARRKRLRDDLDRRERGVKRPFDDGVSDEDDATKLEREVQRIAADGKRRRLEREAQLREERQRKIAERAQARRTEPLKPTSQPQQPLQALPELDRTVRARFRRSPATQGVDSDRVRQIFSIFGSVESAFVMKDKREKLPGSKEKVEVGRCAVTFKSILGAFDAVGEWQKEAQAESLWDEFVDVIWAGGQEPDCIAKIDVEGDPSIVALTTQEQVMIKLKKASLRKAAEIN